MKKTIEQALQELATVRQWEMGKMVEVFGQCTVVELKEYVGFLTISTTGFKKADWVKQAAAKLSDEKFQAEVEVTKMIFEQIRKDTAIKLADMDLTALSMNELKDYAYKLLISYTKHTTKAELVKLIAEKIRELVGEEAEAENDLRVLEDAYEQHRLVDFSGKFLDIRYVEISDIESARERVRLLKTA